MAHYLIYTDGAYYPEHERSAIAYVMIQTTTNEKKEVRRMHQTVKGETSARAELKAIISAVYALPDDADACTIVSDSKYAIDACAGHCIRYHNNELLDLYDDIVRNKDVKVYYSWVKSHNGNFYNEVCDSLCQQAINEYVNKK